MSRSALVKYNVFSVSRWHRFDIHTTFITLKRRRTDVSKQCCVRTGIQPKHRGLVVNFSFWSCMKCVRCEELDWIFNPIFLSLFLNFVFPSNSTLFFQHFPVYNEEEEGNFCGFWHINFFWFLLILFKSREIMIIIIL